MDEKKADLEQNGDGILKEKQEIDLGPSPVDNVVTKDGMRMHPQPTTDPLDPLNWSGVRKHSILAIVMFKYFMFTYITTTT